PVRATVCGSRRARQYLVVDQEPKAGQTAATASAVRLALTLPERPPPPPLPPLAPDHPRFAVAPSLIGLTYPRAIRSTALGTSWRGFWVLLRFTAPLATA